MINKHDFTKNLDDSVIQWIDANNLLTSQGKPFEWFYHSFLLEPLSDYHPFQGTNKSAQVGWSEGMILKVLYAAYKLKWNVIYTLPSDEFLNKFVTPKVDPIINNSALLKSLVSGGVTLKKVGKGKGARFIYFIGAFNSKGASNQTESSKGVSVTADVIVSDEASRSDQYILNQMDSRVENSLYKGKWRFDNPQVPGKGADSIFRKSDQKHWFVQCPHCKHHQYLDWIRLDKEAFKKKALHCYVDPDKKQFVCSKCGREITDETRILGKWIAKYPSRTEYRGYWLSQLCYTMHSVSSILQKDDNVEFPRSLFFNFVLGKPYIGSDVKVNRTAIVKNLDGSTNSLIGNYMGIDQGRVKWYVIGNAQGIFKMGWSEDWDEIEQEFNKYNCVAVCDALPYQQKPKELADKYKGRFFRAFYKSESDQAELAKFSNGNDKSVVLIRREEMIDLLANKINEGKDPLQIPYETVEMYVRHWENLVRITEPDRYGNERFKWERLGDDHLCHARVYMEAAMFKGGNNEIQTIKPKVKGEKEKRVTSQELATIGDDVYEHFAK